MSFDYSWFKRTGLSALQAASHAVTGVVAGDAFSIWSLDYKAAFGLAAGAALGAILGAINEYRLPAAPAAEDAPAAASPEVISEHGPGR